ITVDGSKGSGDLSVPVPAFAQHGLPMSRGLSILLLGLALLLAAGLVSITGTAVREANLEAGELTKPVRVWRARIAMLVAAVTVAATAYFGNVWWAAEAGSFDRAVNFYKPPLAKTTLQNARRLEIRAEGQDPRWSRGRVIERLIPDHGHLMHLFLIRLP